MNDVRRETRGRARSHSVDALACLAGVLTTIGVIATSAVVVAVATASLDLNANDVAEGQWLATGALIAVVAALVVLLAFLAGGYVVGRMSGGRSGAHAAVLVGAFTGALAVTFGILTVADDVSDIGRLLAGEGVPDDPTWTAVLLGFVVAALAAAVVGALTGTRRGVASSPAPSTTGRRTDEEAAAVVTPLRSWDEEPEPWTGGEPTSAYDAPPPPPVTTPSAAPAMVHVVKRAEAEDVGSRYWIETAEDEPVRPDPWATDSQLEGADLRRLRANRRRIRQ